MTLYVIYAISTLAVVLLALARVSDTVAYELSRIFEAILERVEYQLALRSARAAERETTASGISYQRVHAELS